MPQSSLKSMARELNTVAWNHAILSFLVIPYDNSLNEVTWAHINLQNIVFVKISNLSTKNRGNMTIAIVITSYGNWSEEHSTKFLKEDSETKGQFGQQE